MSERVVEMIEALQSKWYRHAKADCDPANGSATIQAAGQRTAKLADELATILAAALEQGSALCRQAADITKLRMELAAMKEQHSADLREIAEMAIVKCDKHWGGDEPITSLEVRAIADSILAAFREKQQKAEVGK